VGWWPSTWAGFRCPARWSRSTDCVSRPRARRVDATRWVRCWCGSSMPPPWTTSPPRGTRRRAMTETPLSAEDAKLVTLARATRARVGAAEGAAVRDTDGRTYAAASVDLPSLTLSAVQVCVAMAYASGSSGLEAVVRLADTAELAARGRGVLGDFAGRDVVVHLGDPRGSLTFSGSLHQF